jgi:FKBP-type peptidyl-prolyl cis-trans isomerase FkpA
MKYYIYLLSALSAVVTIAGCNSLDYKRTKSGLLYKIVSSGNSKDSVAKENQYLKFNFVTKLNDSVLQSSYGKMPGYSAVPPAGQANYSPDEIFGMLRKGDSAVTVMLIDTLLKRGLANQLPPSAKKGDRILTTFKVIEVFKTRELVSTDYDGEMKKDMPRQQKEMQDQMANEKKMRKEQMKKEEEELRKSGEIDRELKAMEDYLASKKISAQKTGKGTFRFREASRGWTSD